jgi:hypothetical protein
MRFQSKDPIGEFDCEGIFENAPVPSSIHSFNILEGKETGTWDKEILRRGMIRESIKAERR